MVADTPENLRLKQQSELQSQVRACRAGGRGGGCVTELGQGTCGLCKACSAEIPGGPVSPPPPRLSYFTLPDFCRGQEGTNTLPSYLKSVGECGHLSLCWAPSACCSVPCLSPPSHLIQKGLEPTTNQSVLHSLSSVTMSGGLLGGGRCEGPILPSL